MPNLSGEIAFRVLQGGEILASRTEYAWTGGGLVLTIATVLPDHDLAFELISTYAAAPSTDTTAIHIVCGQGCDASITTRRYECDSAQLHPVHAPRGCAYDHAQQLIDVLAERGVTVETSEISFDALERVD